MPTGQASTGLGLRACTNTGSDGEWELVLGPDHCGWLADTGAVQAVERLREDRMGARCPTLCSSGTMYEPLRASIMYDDAEAARLAGCGEPMAGVWQARRSSSGVSQLTGPEAKGGCLDAGSHKAEWQRKR